MFCNTLSNTLTLAPSLCVFCCLCLKSFCGRLIYDIRVSGWFVFRAFDLLVKYLPNVWFRFWFFGFWRERFLISFITLRQPTRAKQTEREKANEGMFVCVRLINVLEFRWVCEPVLIMQTRHTFPYCCGVRERPTTKAVQMFVSMLISGLIGYKTQSQTNACPSHSHSPITES